MRALSILVAVLVGVGAAACAEEEPPPSRLVGEIVEVRAEGGRVTSFSLDADGERWEIAVAGDVDYGFNLNHLYEHRDTGDPVDVRLEDRDGDLVALQIDDA